MSIVFLAGASRGVGFEIAQILSQQKITTIALLRNPESQSKLEALNIQVKFGDAMNEAELVTAMKGRSVDTVISTIDIKGNSEY
jgi:NAD(P)-dependent dehydrogenase (short-subunit alcohol dehydrogenase family)